MENIQDRLNDFRVKIVNLEDYKGKFLYDEKTKKFFELKELKDLYVLPKYMYGTYYKPVKIYLDEILEKIYDEYEEVTIDHLNGVEELKKAIDKFNKDNKQIGTYYENYNVIVKLK